MAQTTKTQKTAGISDDAVRVATGMTWPQWLKILDDAGAKQLTHKGIVTYLTRHHRGLGGWWTQMVTVGYEQARGMRRKHETPAGFEISRSRTIEAPVGRVYKAWRDKRWRHKWLDDPGVTVRKATPDKSMRITWVDGKSSVEVNFYPKGTAKTQVTAQHRKLADAEEAERMKAYWATNLDQLRAMLEG